MMRLRCKSILGLFLFLLRTTYARSPIGYEAVVVLVAIELFFAFAVGIACILFSLNMFRALNRSPITPEMYGLLPAGDFPRPLNRTPQIDLKRSQLSERSDLSEDLENEFIDTGKEQYFNTATASRRESEYDIEVNIGYHPNQPQGEERGEEDSGVLKVLRSFTKYLTLW
mmetsp:Transcript_29833/g.28528  ORF Transcript_29833/g.28528 Transcript_29833/m.28528 type:complete len:170 (+) Transcript_29833:94-603(+)